MPQGPRTSTRRRGWSQRRGQGRASAPSWAPRRVASEGAPWGAMPGPARACSCSCSCPQLVEQDLAARGCSGWGGGGRAGTRAFCNATRAGESLHPWQRGSGQAGSPDAFPCRHEHARTPWPLSRSPTSSPALSQLLLHQPSCRQGSSPLLKAKCKETALWPPSLFLCQGSSHPPLRSWCVPKSSERRARQGRDHSSKEDKDAGNGGDPPLP